MPLGPLSGKISRPATDRRLLQKGSQEGVKEHESKAAFIVNETLLAEMKAIAYWERFLIEQHLKASIEENFK